MRPPFCIPEPLLPAVALPGHEGRTPVFPSASAAVVVRFCGVLGGSAVAMGVETAPSAAPWGSGLPCRKKRSAPSTATVEALSTSDLAASDPKPPSGPAA
eukprot:CAMPEP_0171110388 /NCGR_PEP_ID=MMETSP0766_2-20121228/71320_1 /TAXON_ID=439317 /ORGANISM="Gambierdiscus australes, Strain CAWD 149" /LENGTH=99 /DNA_ID=CAMNT_0011572251 /DNA_START=959 /DNA_END=1255 /DNA_ORIENTATION=+